MPDIWGNPTQHDSPSFPAFSQDEEESRLGWLGHKILSGLGFVGQTLDKPGRAVRGLLGGKPEALANLIPFSDTMGWTDPANNVSGRNLLENLGVLSKGVPGSGIDLGDVAGFGVDLLTDPLMYVNPFGLSAKGLQAAKLGKASTAEHALASGKLFPSIPERIAEGQQGLARIGLPWPLPQESTGFVVGTGPRSQEIGKSFSDFGGKLMATRPGVALADLFESGASIGNKQSGTAKGQEMAREINLEMPEKIAQAKIPFLEAGRSLKDTGQLRGPLYDVRGTAEQAFVGPLQKESQAVADMIYQGGVQQRKNELGSAMDVGYTPGYVHRQVTPTADEIKRGVFRNSGTTNFAGVAPEERARNEVFGMLGTTLANDLSVDSMVSGIANKGALVPRAAAIRGLVPWYDDAERLALSKAGKSLDPSQQARLKNLDSLYNKSFEMAKVDNLLPQAEYIRNRIPAYSAKEHDVLQTMADATKVFSLDDIVNKLDKIPGYNAGEHEALEKLVNPSLRESLLGKASAGTATPEELAHLGSIKRLDDLNEMVAFLAHDGKIDPSLRPALMAKAAAGTAAPSELAHLDRIDRLNNLRDIFEKSHDAANLMANLDPKRAEGNLPLFANNVLVDAMNRAVSSASKTHIADKMMDFVGREAKSAAEAGPGASKIMDTVKGIGLTDDALKVLEKKMGKSQSDILKMYIPADVHDAMTRLTNGFTSPEATKPLMTAIDTMANAFKIGNTTLFPARYMRNLVQQGWQMFVGGHGDPRFSELNPQRYITPMMEARGALRDNKVISEASQIPRFKAAGMTDAEATREFQNLSWAHKWAGPERMPRESDVIGQVGGAHAAQANIQVPGDIQPGIGKIVQGAVPTSMQDVKNLAKIQGIVGARETVSKPVLAGRAADELIDDLTRGGSALAMLRQGYEPAEITRQLDKFQYNYSRGTQFEKSVMKRIFPFWAWTRENMPAQLTQLAERPGGATAQAIRLADEVHQKEGFLPPHIAENLALPLGDRTPEGTQRYLSGLGLPFEDAFSNLGAGHGSTFNNVARTLQNLGADMTPLLKVPAEVMAGKQFFSGRQLNELSSKGMTGNVLADELLINSPLSRLLTSARTVMDERKGILGKAFNLLSPGKITDVDMTKQRLIGGRDLLEEYLKAKPEIKQFSRLYVPKDQMANLTQQDIDMMRLETTMIMRQKEAALERRAATGDPGAVHELALLKAKLNK